MDAGSPVDGEGQREAWDPVPPAREPVLEREAEIGSLSRLIRRPGVRLVTVVGQSGVGKTVVAEEAVRRLAAIYPVGVRRVELDGLSDVTAVASLLGAGNTGAPLAAGPAPAGRSRLVLAHGAEGIDGAAQAIAAALDADADLTIVATRVTPFGVRGENLQRIGPLEVVSDGQAEPRAVRFLRQRIAVHGGDSDAVGLLQDTAAEIATLVGGLPLALDLVAARAGRTSLDDVAADLRRRPSLDVLRSEVPDSDDRHRSLRSTLSWTFDALCPTGRTLLGRLAALPGDVELDAVADLCSMPSVICAEEVESEVRSLVDTGLVQLVRPHADSSPRLALSGPVRELAREVLISPKELDDLADRHADHFREVARRARAVLWSPDGLAARHLLRTHRQDLVSAIDRFRLRHDWEAMAGMVTDLTALWVDTGTTALGRSLLDEVLVASAGEETEDGQVALSAEVRAGAAVCSSELRLWEKRSDAPVDQVLAELEESSRWAEAAQDRRLGLAVVEQQVQTLVLAERYDEALKLATLGQATATELGDEWWSCVLTNWRASAANQAGHDDLALDLAVESRDRARRLGDEERVLWASIVLTGIPGAPERLGSATPMLEDLLDLAVRIGDEATEGLLSAILGVRSAVGGDVDGAVTHLRTGLEVARRRDYWHLEELCVLCLIVAAIVSGYPDAGARLHGAVHPLMVDVRRVMSPSQLALYEAMVDSARAAIGEERFGVELRRGSVMGWRQVLTAAEDLMDDMCAARSLDEPIGPDTLAVDMIELRDGGETGPDGDVLREMDAGSAPLTAREREVLTLIAAGMSNKEVAAELGVRPKTVMHHTSSIYRKLGVRTRTEAAAAAWKDGLVDSPA